MTCREAQKNLVELFDSAPPAGVTRELRAHLAACEECAREFAEIQAAVAAVEPPFRVQASPNFKESVMNRLTESPAPVRRWRGLIPRFAVIGAVAAAVVILTPFVGSFLGKRSGAPPSALSLMAQSVEAMSGLQSVHVSARMRTTDAENFEYINAKFDWVPLEMWKQFGEMPRWRVEKPGRVAVMDGVSSLLFLKPNTAVRGGPRPGFLEWLNVLLDPDKVMDHELQVARSGASSVVESQDPSGQIVLTVARKAQGDFTNDWIRNKSVSSSDHTRIYRFDAATKRLAGMELVLNLPGPNVPVFEITEIRYNEPVDPALFSLVLPENVIWSVPPERMPVHGPLPQSPKEAATVLFDAMSREDWEQALVVWPESAVPAKVKEYFGGLRVMSIGEPFQSGLYRGWFVPYEIQLKSGETKKHNLAVRNDNPAGRWVWDGGL